jgi:pimeloyl-ACP methyl ester carboxylesterase
MGEVAAAVSLVPQLVGPMLSENDSGANLAARRAFCSRFVAPGFLPSVPFDVISTWVGWNVHVSPLVLLRLVTRSHDLEPLKEAASNGLPLLLVHGDQDQITDGKVVREKFVPWFKHAEVAWMGGVGHIPFYE